MDRLNLPVEEYTTPNPFTATEDMSLDELIVMMKKHGIRHIPVVRNEMVVGIISERDLKVATGLTKVEKILVRAGDIMVQDPVTVTSDTSLADVAFEMSRRKIGSVIVNDENNRFLGIFTVTDALNALIEVTRIKTKPESSK